MQSYGSSSLGFSAKVRLKSLRLWERLNLKWRFIRRFSVCCLTHSKYYRSTQFDPSVENQRFVACAGRSVANHVCSDRAQHRGMAKTSSEKRWCSCWHWRRLCSCCWYSQCTPVFRHLILDTWGSSESLRLKHDSRIEGHRVGQREVFVDVVSRQRRKRAAQAVPGHVQRSIVVLQGRATAACLALLR